MNRLFAGTPFDIPPECEICGKPESECVCTWQQKADAEQRRQQDQREQQRRAARRPPEHQTAKVRLEKRKGGRKATVISGLTAAANDLPELLARLQSACGTGGTGGTAKTKDDLLELQGDHVDQVRRSLREFGFQVRK